MMPFSRQDGSIHSLIQNIGKGNKDAVFKKNGFGSSQKNIAAYY